LPVSGFGLPASECAFRISCFVFRVSCFVFLVSWFQDPGFGFGQYSTRPASIRERNRRTFRVSGLGFRVPVFGYMVSVNRFRLFVQPGDCLKSDSLEFQERSPLCSKLIFFSALCLTRSVHPRVALLKGVGLWEYSTTSASIQRRKSKREAFTYVALWGLGLGFWGLGFRD